jgi:hypothetical protein
MAGQPESPAVALIVCKKPLAVFLRRQVGETFEKSSDSPLDEDGPDRKRFWVSPTCDCFAVCKDGKELCRDELLSDELPALHEEILQ